MNNYQWLLEMDGEERQAWFDAEHVEGVEIQGGVCDFEHEPDTREKLEADIHSWLTSQVAVSVYVNEIEAEVRKWLDRQAAITWWEHAVGERNPYYPMLYEQLEHANGRIVELEAENDALLAAHIDDVERLDAMGEGELLKQVDELAEERDYWKGQVLNSLKCACIDGYAEEVMQYPTPSGFIRPSLLVNDDIHSLRDFHADDQRLIAKLEADLAASRHETESYRNKLSHAIDNAHDTMMLMDEGMA